MSLACKCIDDGMHSVSCFPRVGGICWKKNPVSSSELKVRSFKSWFRGRYHKEETGKNKRREKRIPESGGEYAGGGRGRGRVRVRVRGNPRAPRPLGAAAALPARPRGSVRSCGGGAAPGWGTFKKPVAAAARASGTPTGVRNRTGAPHASASVPTPSTEQ